MGKRGPPPKPTALKELEGTVRADRSVLNEMRLPTAAPACPEWLSDVARAEWDRVVPVLEATGVLASVDGSSLEGYCASYSRAIEAEHVLKALGLVVEAKQGPVPNPAAAIARNEWAAVRRFAAEFGLTPSARSRVSLPDKRKTDADDTEKDLFKRPGLRAVGREDG